MNDRPIQFAVAVLVATLASSFVAESRAAIVGVDVGDVASVYTGVGVLDSSSRTWDNVADGTPTFSFDGDIITYSTTATVEFNRSAQFSGTIDLYEDGEFGGTSGSITASISGLKTNGTTYDLALYASQGDLARGAAFNIGGDVKTASGVANSTAFILNSNYVLYTGLTPDNAGVISWTYSLAPGDAAFVYNGFEIESFAPISAIPEPSSLALLTLGLTALTGFGSRRRRR